MTHSKGISWFDDCRIPFVDDGDKGSAKPQGRTTITKNGLFNPNNDLVRIELETTQGQGRFPANLLVCDDMLNDGIVYSSGSGDGKLEMININDAHHYNYIDTNRKVKKMTGLQYNDKGTNSRYYDIDKWFDNIISE